MAQPIPDIKVIVAILYHPKLTRWLPAVKKCFEWWEIALEEADFEKETEESARNRMLTRCAKYDYVFIIDSDELIMRVDQITLIQKAIEARADSVAVGLIDYTSETTAAPHCDHVPIVLVNPKKVRFSDKRCLASTGQFLLMKDMWLHHVGRMQDEAVIQWKNEQYLRRNIYDKCWDKLQGGERKIEMPPALRKYLEEK
jgi:hypothetical protein